MISNLPKFHECCYTEKDVANVFIPFGLTYLSDNIYVVPQVCVVSTALYLPPCGLLIPYSSVSSCDVFLGGFI